GCGRAWRGAGRLHGGGLAWPGHRRHRLDEYRRRRARRLPADRGTPRTAGRRRVRVTPSAWTALLERLQAVLEHANGRAPILWRAPRARCEDFDRAKQDPLGL